jgi:hypothetical protein
MPSKPKALNSNLRTAKKARNKTKNKPANLNKIWVLLLREKED